MSEETLRAPAPTGQARRAEGVRRLTWPAVPGCPASPSGTPWQARLPAAGLLATGYRLLATGYRLPATGYRLLATGYRLLPMYIGTGYRLPGTSWLAWASVCLLAAAALGCDERVVINADGADRGLVIMLPGIDGRSGYSEQACRALCRDGPAISVELRDWTSPLGAFFNQTAIGRNREVARTISVRIADYHLEHPARPVYLIGHSGGTAMAVWAAEGLPDGEQVEGIILLASSLSPGYDLSGALARSRSGIVNFHSTRDFAILGAGTTLLGTMDGLHGESAGKAGFESRGRQGYEKLFQVPWEPSMAAAGHGGDHFGCMATRFIRTYVAPLVRSAEWDGGLIASICGGSGGTAPTGDGGGDWLRSGMLLAAKVPVPAVRHATRPTTGTGTAEQHGRASPLRRAGTARQAGRGDYAHGESWQLDTDWDPYYSLDRLLARVGD